MTDTEYPNPIAEGGEELKADDLIFNPENDVLAADDDANEAENNDIQNDVRSLNESANEQGIPQGFDNMDNTSVPGEQGTVNAQVQEPNVGVAQAQEQGYTSSNGIYDDPYAAMPQNAQYRQPQYGQDDEGHGMEDNMEEIMKKRLLTMIAAAGLSVSMLAGCGSNAAADQPSADVTQAAQQSEELAEAPAQATAPKYEVYTDPNGYTVTYDANNINVNIGEDMASFVYMGESAGSCMVIISYVEGKSGEEALTELSSAWGNESAIEKSEGIFPGTEDVKGYWHTLKTDGSGSGLNETGIARDYKDGALLVEILTHIGGDDAIDIPASDALAQVIDSITFTEDVQNVSIDDVLVREHEMTTDIMDCDTFTQVVDKLPAGKGYANVKAGDTDVLLVASGTFDNGDGYMAAIDAEVFAYDADGKITYLGYVTSGGTAYPLAAGEGKLYSAGNHFAAVSIVDKLKLKDSMQAWVEYDADGNATYYTSEDGADAVKADDDSVLTKMYDEMFDSEIIEFSTVQ